MPGEIAPSSPRAIVRGNRCGHDPANPLLTPAHPIRTGKGGLPRILSLAAERAKAWFAHPKKCPPLFSHADRQTRSERREACVALLEALLARMDLASLCLGTPTLSGFIDIDMKAIVRDSGLGQRRCERAIGLLKRAGFMQVKQPRQLNGQGDYLGCRAVRVMTDSLFDWLGLGPMLRRERARATEALRRVAHKASRKLTDFMRRSFSGHSAPSRAKPSRQNLEQTTVWNKLWIEHIHTGLDLREAQLRTNERLGLPPGFSPGRA